MTIFDAEALLSTPITEDEMQDHILDETLRQAAMTDQQARIDTNKARVTEINQSSEEGNYNFSSVGTSKNKVVASLDENGRVSITNVGTGPREQAQTITTPDTAESRLNANNLDNRIRSITGASDSTQAAILHGDLLAEYETMRTNTYAENLKSIEQSMRLEDLEANLARLQEKDTIAIQSGKLYNFSDETIKAQELVTRTKQQANKLAEESVSHNLVLNAMGTKIQSALPAIEAANTRLATAGLKRDAKAEAKAEEADRLVAQTPDYALKRAILLNPKMTEGDAARFLRDKQIRNPDEFQAIMTPSESLPDLVLQGNTAASKFFIEEEMRNTGKSLEAVQDELKAFSTIANDREGLKRFVVKSFGPDSAEAAQIRPYLSGAISITGKAEDKAQSAAVRGRVAKMVMSQMATANFNSNLTEWKEPILEDTLAQLRKTNLEPTLDNALPVFLGDSKGEERRAKVDQFGNIMRHARNRANVSTLGQINVENEISQLARYYMRDAGVLETAVKSIKEMVSGSAVSDLMAPSRNALDDFSPTEAIGGRILAAMEPTGPTVLNDGVIPEPEVEEPSDLAGDLGNAVAPLFDPLFGVNR